MKNILITGCAGFIGSSLSERLLNFKDYNVIGVDNFDDYYSRDIKENNIKNFINKSNFIFYETDIRDTKKIAEIFNTHKIDIVVHIAAKAGVRYSFEQPQEYVSVNVGGTVNLLEAMVKFGVKKIVFASSSSVYGNCKAEKFREDLIDLQQISPYALSKKNCEDYIKLYSEQYNISAVALRFFTVFGPKQRPDLAIHKFCSNIMKNEPITLYGDGTTLRDYTYIDNILDGIIASMYYDKTKFEIINLGSANPINLNLMVEYIEKEMGKTAQKIYLPMQKGDVIHSCADISKAKKLLDYKPAISFEEGLHIFVQKLVL